MATYNDEANMQYSPQRSHFYQPQSMYPSNTSPTAGSSADGANTHVRYADEVERPMRPKQAEAVQRVGGGRSGRRTGTGTGTGLGLSIWKNKNKEKRNGKKKSKDASNDGLDESQPQMAKMKPIEEVIYRGQAGGARSGRGLSIPIPTSRGTDKYRSGIKGKGISSPIGADDGSETGSILSIGLGVPAEQWEREMGLEPLSKRTFDPNTLRALRNAPLSSPPSLSTTSQAGSSSMASNSGSRLGTWSEEDEEEDDTYSDYRESSRSRERTSIETFRRYPPPQYSTIQTPSIDPRMHNEANKRGGVRPLPMRPESPMGPPFPNSPTSPRSASSASSNNTRVWPMPPQPAYAQSLSSASSSSMPATPPTHPLDLYARRGRSKSPGPGQGLGLRTYSPTMVPWEAPGFGNRSEDGLHTPNVEFPGNAGGNRDEPGIISGVFSGVDAAGRPYQYTYQYQSASGAPPSPEELMATLTTPQYPRPGQYTPPPPPIRATSPPPQVFRSPAPPPQLSPQQHPNNRPQQRPPKKRLVISGIGAPGANDLNFDFDRALNELHLAESGDDRSDRDGGHDDNDGNDSDIDPAISKNTRHQKQNQAGENRGSGVKSPGGPQRGSDKERDEAVIQWCRGFGEVLEVRRRGQDCLMVEFVKDGVVEFICRAQQVYIKGAGKVDLGWC